MNLRSIKKLKEIIASCYEDVGEGGKYIDTLWTGIYNSNLDFEFHETYEALIEVLRFLLESRFVTLHGFYDVKNKKEVVWEGGTEEILNLLNNYLSNFSKKDTEDNPAFLDQFKYCVIKWKVQWPIDLEKYGIKSA